MKSFTRPISLFIFTPSQKYKIQETKTRKQTFPEEIHLQQKTQRISTDKIAITVISQIKISFNTKEISLHELDPGEAANRRI